ncbi:hypothetical protein [Allocoleopsis sp.]|uniref:hypothetical protein n=1 Tax=Allocoleopsis sp. TaxID=3088169 RepID=UPI002FCF5740
MSDLLLPISQKALGFTQALICGYGTVFDAMIAPGKGVDRNTTLKHRASLCIVINFCGMP